MSKITRAATCRCLQILMWTNSVLIPHHSLHSFECATLPLLPVLSCSHIGKSEHNAKTYALLPDSRHHQQQAPNSVMRGRASNQEGGEVQLVTAGGRGGGRDPKEKNDVIQLEERQKWEDGSGAGEGRGRHTQHDGSAAVSFSSTAAMGLCCYCCSLSNQSKGVSIVHL